jgi:hypothetical protein
VRAEARRQTRRFTPRDAHMAHVFCIHAQPEIGKQRFADYTFGRWRVGHGRGRDADGVGSAGR